MSPGFGTRFHSARVRPFVTKISRLPLASRGILLLLCAVSFAGFISSGLRTWLSLTPGDISLANLRPLSTYPFVHKNLIHLALNVASLFPLIERFESEFGTLTTFILFTGPFSTAPGALYTLTQRYLFHSNVPVLGSSGWVFLLLAAEARKTHQTNPFFHVSKYKIPTWSLPLLLILVTHFLIPGSSITGHIFGAAVGYFWSVSRLRFIILPPERLLRYLEDKLDLVRRLPHYISLDRKTYGRYGLQPANSAPLPLLPLTILNTPNANSYPTSFGNTYVSAKNHSKGHPTSASAHTRAGAVRGSHSHSPPIAAGYNYKSSSASASTSNIHAPASASSALAAQSSSRPLRTQSVSRTPSNTRSAPAPGSSIASRQTGSAAVGSRVGEVNGADLLIAGANSRLKNTASTTGTTPAIPKQMSPSLRGTSTSSAPAIPGVTEAQGVSDATPTPAPALGSTTPSRNSRKSTDNGGTASPAGACAASQGPESGLSSGKGPVIRVSLPASDANT